MRRDALRLDVVGKRLKFQPFFEPGVDGGASSVPRGAAAGPRSAFFAYLVEAFFKEAEPGEAEPGEAEPGEAGFAAPRPWSRRILPQAGPPAPLPLRGDGRGAPGGPAAPAASGPLALGGARGGGRAEAAGALRLARVRQDDWENSSLSEGLLGLYAHAGRAPRRAARARAALARPGRRERARTRGGGEQLEGMRVLYEALEQGGLRGCPAGGARPGAGARKALVHFARLFGVNLVLFCSRILKPAPRKQHGGRIL